MQIGIIEPQDFSLRALTILSDLGNISKFESGKIEDQPAPEIAINYWNLPLHATLKDVVRVIRDDEAGHRDVNHSFADILEKRKEKKVIKTISQEKNFSQE